MLVSDVTSQRSWREADLDLFLGDLFLALTELYCQLEFEGAEAWDRDRDHTWGKHFECDEEVRKEREFR